MATLQEALAIALDDHQQGRLQRAASIYKQILAADPHHADALHLLGVVSHQEGDYQAATTLIHQAISEAQKVQQDTPFFYNSLGNVLSDQKDFASAIQAFEAALTLAPNEPEFWLNLGSVYYQQKTYEKAQETLNRALTLAPDLAEAYVNLGNIDQDLGQPDQAIAYYEQALQANPALSDAWFNLGNLYRAQWNHLTPEAKTDAEALKENILNAYQQAIFKDPHYLAAYINLGVFYNQLERFTDTLTLYQPLLTSTPPPSVELYNNLGNAYRGLEDFDHALACYEQALSLQPDYADGWYNLGNLYRVRGQLPQAAEAYEKALACKENQYADVHVALATVLFMMDQLPQSIDHFQLGLSQNPTILEAYDLLGLALNRLNRTTEAIAVFEKAYHESGKDSYLIKSAISTPCIYPSEADRKAWRNRTLAQLEKLSQRALHLDNPVMDAGTTNFYQAYHGENERDFQQQFARLFQHLPRYDVPSFPNNTKCRVGFISHLLRSRHTIGELNQGFFDLLDRKRFEVIVICVDEAPTRQDPVSLKPDAGDTMVWIPEADLEAASRMIQAQSLDVLFYTDIGMDPTTYFLAMSRLAPVQCVTWGHPVTSGIDTLDYFISWKGAEVAEAQTHYTEKLVLLDEYTSYFYRPTLPAHPKTRSDFGLDPEANLYICSQTLFKLQPDFDILLAGILRGDPKAQLALIHLRYPQLAEDLMARWQRTMPDVTDRIRFVPRMSNEDFTVFQTLADVLLDPTHFVGGTTTLEAFAFGTPIVTLPSPYLKGRWTAAFYQLMGIEDCIAQSPEDYIKIALRLGQDKTYRKDIKNRILEKVSPLFENPAIVRSLETFLLSAVETAKTQHLPTPTHQEGSP